MGLVSDGVILNVETQEVITINPNSQIKFDCQSESFMEMPGFLISIVCDSNYNIQMMRYSQADNSITCLHNYGDWRK